MNSLSGVLLLLPLSSSRGGHVRSARGSRWIARAPAPACAFRFALIIYAAVTRNIYLSVIFFFCLCLVCVCWERCRENKTQIERTSRRRRRNQTMTISDSFLGLFFVFSPHRFHLRLVCYFIYFFSYLIFFWEITQKKKISWF